MNPPAHLDPDSRSALRLPSPPLPATHGRRPRSDLVGGVPRRVMEAARMTAGEDIIPTAGSTSLSGRARSRTDFIQIDPHNASPPASPPRSDRVHAKTPCTWASPPSTPSQTVAGVSAAAGRVPVLGDRFHVALDTFPERAIRVFLFEMNPSGLWPDAVFGVERMNRAWDGIWDARVRHSEIGWTIEIVIPFRTLNFDPANDTWGINFQRTVRRKNEDSIWMGWSRNQGLGRMTNAGRVTGITEVTQGHGLDIKPYGLFT